LLTGNVIIGLKLTIVEGDIDDGVDDSVGLKYSKFLLFIVDDILVNISVYCGVIVILLNNNGYDISGDDNLIFVKVIVGSLMYRNAQVRWPSQLQIQYPQYGS
jgi:hypothetical protein